MEYIEAEAAEDMSGLRLALTAGAPAPYSMSARAVLDIKGVEYVPVLQIGGGANEALVAWTRQRNAPVALYNDEAPRAGWLEILNLAERLGSGASLLPDDIHDRMGMIGWVNELIGENGWIWNMRLLMLGLGGPERAAQAAAKNPMFAQYGYSEAARERAQAKAELIMTEFSKFAAAQSSPHYLVGGRLSALDIYWAYFSLIARTLPEDQCPMPGGLRKSYDYCAELMGGADEGLVKRRDWMFANHLPLPMTF